MSYFFRLNNLKPFKQKYQYYLLRLKYIFYYILKISLQTTFRVNSINNRCNQSFLSELLLLLQTTCVFAEVVVVANTIILCVTVSFHFVLNHIHGHSSSSSCFTKIVYTFGMRQSNFVCCCYFFVSNLNTGCTPHNIFRRLITFLSFSFCLLTQIHKLIERQYTQHVVVAHRYLQTNTTGLLYYIFLKKRSKNINFYFFFNFIL